MREKRYKAPNPVKLKAQCDTFNQIAPIGTEVDYHPVIGEAECKRSRTRSEAYVLSGHTAVVFLEGIAGCVALDAITIPEAPR